MSQSPVLCPEKGIIEAGVELWCWVLNILCMLIVQNLNPKQYIYIDTKCCHYSKKRQLWHCCSFTHFVKFYFEPDQRDDLFASLGAWKYQWLSSMGPTSMMSPFNSGDLTPLGTKQPFLPSQKWQLFGEMMIFPATSCQAERRNRNGSHMKANEGKRDRFHKGWRF